MMIAHFTNFGYKRIKHLYDVLGQINSNQPAVTGLYIITMSRNIATQIIMQKYTTTQGDTNFQP